jgi:hypothetical protein
MCSKSFGLLVQRRERRHENFVWRNKVEGSASRGCSGSCESLVGDGRGFA